jgi:hypothetical protein
MKTGSLMHNGGGHPAACNRLAGFAAWTLAALVPLLVIRPTDAQEAQPRIAIDDAAFTPRVAADRQPAERLTGVAAGQQPYFWTLLSANAAILEALRAQGKLPIRHTWLRTVGPVLLERNDLAKLGDDISLDLGTAALAEKLQYEVDHSPNGTFTWRTWSQRGRLRAGTWTVFLKYADGSPVLCQVVNGAGIPCAYHLEVRGP